MAFPPSGRDHFFRIPALALAALCLAGVLWAQESPAPAESSRFNRPLIVGAATDSYPYAYLNGNGKSEGFAMELLDAVAAAMDLRIVRVSAPSSEIADRFQRGEFDLLQSFSQGPGRETYADFSTPYMVLQGTFFVRKDDTRFTSPDQLAGAEVALAGFNSIGEKYFQDNGIAARIVHTRAIEESLINLNAGKYDAAFSSRLGALSYIELYNLRNIRPLGKPLDGYDIRPCFAVHRGDTALLARLNEGLAILNRNGDYERIHQKWFGRFEKKTFSREQVATYIAIVLALALLATASALIRQRMLRERIVGQSRQIAENEAILAEAQHIARLGHWRYDTRTRATSFSDESLRILGRQPADRPPSYLRILSMMSRFDRSLIHRCIRSGLLDNNSSETTVTLRPPAAQSIVVHVTTRPLYDTRNTLVGLFGTVQDITRQKASEEALHTREQLLRALYDNIPIAMGVVELSGTSFRFISANVSTANLFGLGSTPLAGRVFAELPLPAATVDFWSDWFRRGLAEPEFTKAETLQETTRRHYAITLVPLENEQGRRQLCFLIEDVTERKQMDTEVAQGRRLRAIGELVGGIAHEFNNLLTPIMLKAEILAIELARDPERLEELKIINQAARRGADLTKRLLTLGRRSENRPELVRLEAVVHANLELLKPTIDRRIALVANLAPSLPPLFVNSADVHQIILNLLLNARDTLLDRITRENPRHWSAQITIEAFETDTADIDHASPSQPAPASWICLSISDNGMGMRQEVLERIFEPFYTTKGVGRGTGLGLATVWHLLTRLGGRVTVDSKPDAGSTFNLWFPVVPAAQDASRSDTTLTSIQTKKTALILLVEDDDLVAETVGLVLRRAGHAVTRYANGSEAWRHLQKKPGYDLLLLDLDLPGISGIEIARRARNAKHRSRILIASGRLSEAEVRDLDELRVEGKLQKPFMPSTLTSAVQACLNGTLLPSGAPIGLSSDPFTDRSPGAS